MYNYVVTAQKPTVVLHSTVGNFTSPSDMNLILVKSTRIEIHQMTAEGLQPYLDVAIYGRVFMIKLFRPEGEDKDLLFFATERLRFSILEYDTSRGEIVTRANGNMKDRIGRPKENGPLGIMDPDGRMFGMHLYDGLFKVIPMEKSVVCEAYNIRLEELHVLDMQFLSACPLPTLLVLYQDAREHRHLKTYVVQRDKDFHPGPWNQPNVEGGASMLIALPPPLGGALVLGEQTIAYFSGRPNDYKSIPLQNTATLTAYGAIDASRYLIGDLNGRLYVLALQHSDNHVESLKLEQIGETSSASALSYLDNGVVFVGSSFGDSQIVKLTSEDDEAKVQVLDTMTNLGPIVDFCVVDVEKQGQGQVVTCSGALKDGSLRIIRNGIGINEQATADIEGIKGMWSLRPTLTSQFDKYLVQTFIGETRILMITEDEMAECEIDGFDAQAQSLFCANVVGDKFVQVTERSVRLVDCTSLALVSQWSPTAGARITVGGGNASQVLLALGGGILVYLEVKGDKIEEIMRTTLEHEISCLTISATTASTDDANPPPATFCAVGMWTDISVRVLTVPELKPVDTQLLGGEIIPRSVLLSNFEGVCHLLCALGDGHLFDFVLDTATGQLASRKKVSLGTQPIVLSPFRHGSSAVHVFAASDRPTVIYSSSHKLVYSNVNVKEVTHMAPFNSEGFPDSLALATESMLTIGTIDDIQKLHIRTVPLGEQPRRIAHQESSRCFAVITEQMAVDENGEGTESFAVRLIDDTTFETVHVYPLDALEWGCSLISCSFTDDARTFFVVGTAYVLPDEAESSRGRVLVFQVVDHTLKLVTEREAAGSVYTLDAFNGKLLAGINSKVQLYQWTDVEEGVKELSPECGYHGSIMVLLLESRGDFIMVADLMKSISVLAYKSVDSSIDLVAHDFNPNWMAAAAVLDDDTFLGAENWYNLFTVRKNTEGTTDDERQKLDVVGEFHLGDFVNRFRQGSLVMQLPDGDAPATPAVIFGTVSGAIGVVATLSAETYATVSKIEKALTEVIKGIGGIPHEHWRAFGTDVRSADARGFIDGDLVEMFLELPRPKMEAVAHATNISVDDLVKLVEDLSHCH